MRSVDTNVLVRLIVRDDPAQTAAAERFVAAGAWVSHLVLAETAWVLTSVYDRSSKDLGVAIDALLDHQHLVLQDGDVVRSAREVVAKRPTLTFSDCLIVAIATRAGHTPVGTFDRDLSKLPEVDRL